MDAKNIACSACYGSGYGVDEKPCPCGCRPGWSPAIAPPVAAGSVDTEKLGRLVATIHDANLRGSQNYMSQSWDSLVTWAQQQREAGRVAACAEAGEVYDRLLTGQRQRAEKAEEGLAQLQYERDNLQKLAISRREWAEKAEAELKQVKANHAFLVERNRALKEFADTTQSAFGVLLKKHRELQSSSHAANPIDPSDMPC